MGAIRRWLHDRPRWMWLAAGLVVVALVAATAVALTGDGGDDTVAIEDDPVVTTTTTTPTTITTTSTTTTAAPTTAAPTTTRPSSMTTTTPPATTTTVPPGPVPGAVTVIHAGRSAGSGEISVKWDRVEGATGYRVLRSSSAGGAFAVVADFDATPGQTIRFAGGITVWTPTGYPWIEYIEYGESRTRWFQVVAYNANGDAPPSVTVSGSI